MTTPAATTFTCGDSYGDAVFKVLKDAVGENSTLTAVCSFYATNIQPSLEQVVSGVLFAGYSGGMVGLASVWDMLPLEWRNSIMGKPSFDPDASF